jgi:hypothetical protein
VVSNNVLVSLLFDQVILPCSQGLQLVTCLTLETVLAGPHTKRRLMARTARCTCRGGWPRRLYERQSEEEEEGDDPSLARLMAKFDQSIEALWSPEPELPVDEPPACDFLPIVSPPGTWPLSCGRLAPAARFTVLGQP